jgi:histidinol-phosphate phosphatase family protein
VSAEPVSGAEVSYAVVIPSIGRPSLDRLLLTLEAQSFPAGAGRPAEIVVVDDRPAGASSPLRVAAPVRVVRSFGRGPAAARNAGWVLTSAAWVVFLDDDVELPPGWAQALAADLSACPDEVGGCQAAVVVPLPADRRPTDWQRGTAGLQNAAWATADMAYRRAALSDVSGFDERFPRAYREDTDLAIRVRRAGWTLTRGQRQIIHPVRPVDDWVSLRVQRGNADDVLMRRLHGRDWRAEGSVPTGRLPFHLITVGAAGLALALSALGHRRAAGAAAGVWAGFTVDFARRRIAPGPRPGDAGAAAEWRRMVLTSVAIPPAALWHRLRAHWRYRRPVPSWPVPLRAVLFDRDGTLVHDVPYNGDPSRVRPVEGAAEAVLAARAAGLRIGVVTNQSGIARGLINRDQALAVNAEIDRRLGPFDTWQLCPHADADRCDCRKPLPGLVLQAARELGLRPQECAVVGDIGADVAAARAAGARAVLVPNAQTRRTEITDAPLVAETLRDAVQLLIDADGKRRG